jgi:hypothetical protein
MARRRHRSRSRSRSRSRRRGRGFGSWIKGAAGTVMNKVIKPVAKIIKDNKVVSSALAASGNPTLASMALNRGWGRKRRRSRSRRGRGYAVG